MRSEETVSYGSCLRAVTVLALDIGLFCQRGVRRGGPHPLVSCGIRRCAEETLVGNENGIVGLVVETVVHGKWIRVESDRVALETTGSVVTAGAANEVLGEDVGVACRPPGREIIRCDGVVMAGCADGIGGRVVLRVGPRDFSAPRAGVDRESRGAADAYRVGPGRGRGEVCDLPVGIVHGRRS